MGKVMRHTLGASLRSEERFSRNAKMGKVMRHTLGASLRSEERFSRNAETDLVCRLLLEKKKKKRQHTDTDHQMRTGGRRDANLKATDRASMLCSRMAA